jgi:hypothetical protein
MAAHNVTPTAQEFTMIPNKQEMRNMYRNGDSAWEILACLTGNGIEFPEASYMVTSALGLDAEETEQMERDYDECC